MALHSRSELIQGITRRFPDLAMENFGLAEVHPSMQTIDPVANSGTLRYVVIPAEEDHLVYIALELNLPPYHKTGSISVPPRLRKARLIAQTGINIVCGPTGELLVLSQWMGVERCSGGESARWRLHHLLAGPRH